MTVCDDLLMYVGTLEDIEREKSEAALEAALSEFRPNPEALNELAYAGWRKLGAPRFPAGTECACHHHPNPDLWFSDEPAERIEAARICTDECQAVSLCESLTLDEAHGIWAGRSRDGRPVDNSPTVESVCRKGHNDWRLLPSGRRRCRTCHAKAESRRRALNKARGAAA